MDLKKAGGHRLCVGGEACLGLGLAVGLVPRVTFANDSQLIINLQRPLHEIWMAARAGGFHYRWADGIWHDTKTGNDFFADLSTLASDCAGRPLAFTA